MRLLAGGPSAEGAWLVVLVLRDCPLEPAGGLEPRAVERLVLLQRTVALEEGLLELAAVAGSLDAAVAFVVAKDAGTDGYVIVLHCLVQADSAAWIADVLAMLAALARVELGAFCLGAAATDAHPAGAGPAAAAGLASAGLDPAAGRGALALGLPSCGGVSAWHRRPTAVRERCRGWAVRRELDDARGRPLPRCSAPPCGAHGRVRTAVLDARARRPPLNTVFGHLRG
ncbi:hypothetical protein ACFXPZ_38875 [Streptomyces sp. NPDC059101]|uniref:hypothetical protein n=1 Tax=Streptomyces sp. NPDC059101 TaxID=3346728 RepID=UPI003699DB23